MQLSGLLDLLRAAPGYQALRTALNSKQPLDDLALLRAARPFVTMALAEDF